MTDANIVNFVTHQRNPDKIYLLTIYMKCEPCLRKLVEWKIVFNVLVEHIGEESISGSFNCNAGYLLMK